MTDRSGSKLRTRQFDPLLSFKIVYERAESAKKRPSAERVACAKTGRSPSKRRTSQFDPLQTFDSSRVSR